MKRLAVLLSLLLAASTHGQGGTAAIMLSFGDSGGGGGLLNLTNHTIGINTNQTAAFDVGINAPSDCGGLCGGMAGRLQAGVFTNYNDEFLTGWQTGSPYAVDVGMDYEIRWSQVSGTLEFVPTDICFTPLPEDTWSYSEWTSAMSLYAAWQGGSANGPRFSQGGGSADTVITVEIRRIDLTDGPVSATITFNP